MFTYDVILRNLEILKERVIRTCDLCGRSHQEVELLPVTKTHSIEAVRYAYEMGFTAVGENRVQEALDKMDLWGSETIRWELIGHLQSNKAKLVPGRFARVQSLDSLKLATRLDRFAGEANTRLSCLIQVNTGEDPNKYGFLESEVEGVLEAMLSLSNLHIEGFMTIGPLEGGREAARIAFARLRELAEGMRTLYQIELPVLSMGMSGDLEEAVMEGSTQIRVGSALFGQRN